MKLTRLFFYSLLTSLFLAPSVCNAHPGHTESFGLVNGINHPFSGLDHFIVILLVGFWSAVGFKRSILGPLSFITGMILGSTTGLLVKFDNSLEVAIALTVVITGLAIISRRNFPENLSLFLLTLFGAFHGLAHTSYLPEINTYNAADISMDLLGLVLGTLFLHITGLLVSKLTINYSPVIPKATGIATAMYGVVLLTQLSI